MMRRFLCALFLLMIQWSGHAATVDDYMLDYRSTSELAGHEGEISQVMFVPGSDHLLLSTGYKDKTVRLWDVRKRQQLDMVKLSFGPRDFVISPDGKMIHVIKNTGGIKAIALTNGKLGKPRSHWGQAGKYGRMAISLGGKYLAIVSRNKPVTVWNVEKKREHQSYIGTVDYRAVDFAPNDRIFAAVDAGNTLAIWDILALKGFGAKQTYEARGVYPDAAAWDVSFSRSGQQLAVTYIDGHVVTWRLADAGIQAEQAHTFTLPKSAFSVEFSPSGQLLAATSQTGSVYFWEMTSGRQVKEYKGHAGYLLPLAFNSNASVMAAGSLDGTVVVWQ